MGGNVKNSFDPADSSGDNVLNLDGSVKRGDESICFDKVITVTLAEINAGLEVIEAIEGKQIKVVDFSMLAVGSLAGSTSVDLEEGSALHTKVATVLTAALSDGAFVKPNTANVTLGAGFMAPLVAGEPLKIVNEGGAGTTLTSIKLVIKYQVI